MSGHSKWSTIKREKGAKDAARGAVFTKLGNAIAIAARSGFDPETNFALRLAIDKAKASNMPHANIQRAIDRIKDKGAAELQEVMYEGYGPGGVAILVEVATDNLNRTYPEVRLAFSKHGGNIAEKGAVAFQFTRKGYIRVKASGDDFMLEALDAGAEHLIIGLGSKTTSEAWILPADEPLGQWRCVRPRVEGVEYDVEIAGETLLIVHNIDNPEGDLAWTARSDPSTWQPVLSSGPGERFLAVDAFTDFAILTLRAGGLPTLRVLPRDASRPGGFGDPIPWPNAGELTAIHLGENPESGSAQVLITQESYVQPRATYAVDPLTGQATLLKRQPVLGGFDPTAYLESREWVTAADGARIPVSIVRRADVRPDASAPGLLSGYGAYEISNDPYFSVARLSLLDRGVVYAVAHVRGGGEMGRQWYEAGKLAAKANTFTDFVAVADALRGTWVDPQRLGAEGGSAGGLLIGAVLNLAPDRFRVAHAAVPFVDALTSMLDPDLPLTAGEWEEWGNPLADPDAYATMASYAPYDNVRPTGYPALLVTTSLHDTRVLVTEPAKWVARLRELATNDPGTRPILMRTELSAGHGGRSGRYDAWREVAWEWAVVLDQLGVAP